MKSFLNQLASDTTTVSTKQISWWYACVHCTCDVSYLTTCVLFCDVRFPHHDVLGVISTIFSCLDWHSSSSI